MTGRLVSIVTILVGLGACGSESQTEGQAQGATGGVNSGGATSGGTRAAELGGTVPTDGGTAALSGSGGSSGSGAVGGIVPTGGAGGVGGAGGSGPPTGGLEQGGGGGLGSGGASGASGTAGVVLLGGSGGLTQGGTAGTMAGASGGGGVQVAGSAGRAGAGGGATEPIVEAVPITTVWSGHPVEFGLVTHGDWQFAAFYAADRAMTVASRRLGETVWEFATLPSTLGWDSHNYVTLAVDQQGYIHVSGNMHNVPLVYFRTTAPLDITTFERVASMVGANEQSVTYPEFFHGPGGNLVFAYRDGGSGNGNHIFNQYETATRTWSRLLDTPLTDGEGQRNAYPVGPIQGPDGNWHLVWVWRDTPDAATNHDLSYARSADLVHWETGAGQPLSLPITLGASDIVDPVPSGGGIINNNTKVGFDSERRPVVVYHKYDGSGLTQLYNARLENGVWVVHQTSDWDYRWDFGGGGTLVFEIEVEPVTLQLDGTLTQTYYHAQYAGWGAFLLNETTLGAEATIDPPLPYPRELDGPTSPTPGMIVRWQMDAGEGSDSDVRYMLRWETLASNRDEPRDAIPPPTELRLYAVRQSALP